MGKIIKDNVIGWKATGEGIAGMVIRQRVAHGPDGSYERIEIEVAPGKSVEVARIGSGIRLIPPITETTGLADATANTS